MELLFKMMSAKDRERIEILLLHKEQNSPIVGQAYKSATQPQPNISTAAWYIKKKSSL